MNTTTHPFHERRSRMIESGAWNDNTITHYLDQALTSVPDRTAIVSYRVEQDERTALSYRELDRIATRIAAGLAAMGVQKGEVVSCQLPNGWQITALHLACVRIGAILNPLMPIFRERELRFMLRHAESRVLVIPQLFRGFDYAAMIAGLRTDLPDLAEVLVIGGKGECSFEQRLLETSWEAQTDVDKLFAERRLGGDDPVQLLYTSGTTGEPKGVLHSSNTLFANARPYSERLHLSADDRVLMASPMAHQTGFLYGLMMPIYLQTTAVLQDIWNVDFALKVIAAEQPAFTMASTPFLADLVEAADRHPGALDSLKIFVAAGAPIPGALVEKAAAVMKTRIISAWGMTENGAVTMTRPEDDASVASHSDGTPLPWMEVRVVDPDGRPLPAGMEGQLMVRGASLFIGYLKRPELYNVDADGWFPTGDLARIDGRGYIRITGRSKDVIVRGGENIPVIEVENLLYKHPAIASVALVGCPDDRLGERLCAYITLHPDYETLTLNEVVDYLLEQQISKTYLPEYVEVLTSMPQTPSGKIQKFKLREQASRLCLAPARRSHPREHS
ncbi:AMP-binding protein [Marinobacterium aestuariivivens]|uniref:AMP-binding protein n=1 Tax=Marinobacterium aestuariivivens TaxID=1698799 RepID=A0ABW2A213_9GAMM